MEDPGLAVVEINIMARELSALTAVSINPDVNRIAEIATEIRDRAQSIKLWAYKKGEKHE
jgi:hypothetical protein